MRTLVTLIYALNWLLALFISYQVIRDRRSPTSTVAWISVFFLLPILGALLYLLLGVRKLRRPRRQRILQWPQSARTVAASRLEALLQRLGASPPTGDNEICLHLRAQEAREALAELIDGAQHEVWAVVFTFQTDRSGRYILEHLMAAARRGVKVRLLVDDIGSARFCPVALRDFKQSGCEVNAFKPVWRSMLKRVANLRNHRKIFCADGRRAWLGGRNIGDEYLADHAEEARWSDVSATVRGPASRQLEAICRSDWAFVTETKFVLPAAAEDAAPDPPERPVQVQVLASGPEQREDVWHTAFLKCCYEAQERLYVATPYFVPDEIAFKAIAIAARNGVDVRIMVPEQSDYRLVDLVAASYLRELQYVGVKVYRYGKMMHAKYVLVDDALSFIGSANINARSFYLDYEVMALVTDSVTNQRLREHFTRLEARALHGLNAAGWWSEFLGLALRMFSPML